MSPSSMYSENRNSDQPGYVPPRSHWAAPSPLGAQSSSSQTLPNRNHNLSPIAASPTSAVHSANTHRRTPSDAYYEDVDPRFASDEMPPPSPVPHALIPGGTAPQRGLSPAPPNRYPSPQHLHPNGSYETNPNSASDPSLPRNGSYENIPEGARSPAGSDASHFTSVSQRGVNPNWRPGPGSVMSGGSQMGGNMGMGGQPMNRGPRRDDVILGANPDFALPGAGGRGRGGMGGMRGRGGGGMGRGGPMGGMGGMPGAGNAVPAGRYPTDI